MGNPSIGPWPDRVPTAPYLAEQGHSLQAVAPLPRLSISPGELVVAVIAACGLFATYTAIRAANRMAALQYVSDNSNSIAEMEKTIPELLCLIGNSVPLEGTARAGCDQSIFSSGNKL